MKEASDRAKALLADIRRAYSGVTRGSGISLCKSLQLDDYVPEDQLIESEEAKMLDPGTDWTQISQEWLARFGGKGGLSFVDAQGFRYYLPAVMTLFIEETEGLVTPRGCLTEMLVYHLSSTGPLDHFSILSDAQSRVVRSFLEYVAADPRCDCLDVQPGLTGHWKQFAD